MDDVERLLVLEDDVYFVEGFRDQVARFLRALPGDWQQAYLGGQHLSQRKRPPRQVNSEVVRPQNVNRTHAYALHRRGMRPVYKWLTDYAEHSQRPAHHIDHRLGALHSTGRFAVYAPHKWFAGQAESHSSIKGRIVPQRIWSSIRLAPDSVPFVAVIGLHCSGSSCLAGVLHALGVHMGDQLTGQKFEAKGLIALCEEAYPFPSTMLEVSRENLIKRLRLHVESVQSSARTLGRVAGGKYPHLCAVGEELQSICGASLKLIHIARPLEESIASLQTRSRDASGSLQIDDAAAERVQRWLWHMKNKFLEDVEHLTVHYHDLLDDPREQIARICSYLELQPDESAITAAVAHVQSERAGRRRPHDAGEQRLAEAQESRNAQ